MLVLVYGYSISEGGGLNLPHPSGLRPATFSTEKANLYPLLGASSPKHSRREMKRGDDGAAVKIHRRSKP